MFSKMKYSIFLFLQLFMMKATFINRVWRVQKDNMTCVEITDAPDKSVDHNEGYIFLTPKRRYVSLIYVVGAQLKPYQKYKAASSAAKSLAELYNSVKLKGKKIYFRRITSDSTINQFADVQKWESVLDKIPRLYVVSTFTIYQIPFIPEAVKNVDTFLLHDGSTVTVYYSHSSSKNIRNLAKSFAKYIVEFEKNKYNVDTRISELGLDKENSNDAFQDFVKKIKLVVETHRESKTNSLQKNDMDNSKTINEKISIADDEDEKNFEEIKKRIFETCGGIYISTWTDTKDYERILCSATASTSSAPTSSASTSTASSSKGRKNKANQRTTQKGQKEKNPSSVATPLADLNFLSKSTITTFGTGECHPRNQTVVSSCVYVIWDIENSESFIYFGREASELYYHFAVAIAEIFLDRYPSGNVSYIVDDGNLLPPSFIIRFKKEFKKILKK